MLSQSRPVRPVVAGLAAAALVLPLAPAISAAAAPVPPTSVRVAHATPGALGLRWNAVPDATGYVLTRSDTLGGEYTEIARTDARTVFATDAGADTTEVSYYRVRAIGADGESAPSAAAVGTLVGDGVPEPAFPENGVLTLDLGSGAVAAGATGIDADTRYGVDQRIGFVDPGQVTATDRGGADALRSDFVTVGDTELVADLPNGDYRVRLVAGDAQGATDIALTAEQMVKVQSTQKAAGEYLEMEFDLALVDGQLNLELSGGAANLAALTLTRTSPRAAGPKPTVYLTGDSTVQTYDQFWAPQAGWGQMIDRFLSDDVVVANHSIGGRSSKNFISQGRLDAVLTQIRPGDYLYVQFGHNDNSYGVDDRYAAPADYRNYLRTYIEGARQRGATPIIVTPVSRRSYDSTGQANVSFPQYVEQAAALAAETDTPLVDLSASSRQYLTEIGPEEAKSVFLHVPAGVYPNRPNGTADDTHFQNYGAIQMARLVARDTAELDVPLAGEVVDAEPPAAVPEKPAGVVAGSVTASGATLSWTEVDGADIYRVYAKTSAAPDSDFALVATSTLGRADITGLAEGTAYDLRVVAVNGRGESAPSDVVTLTTKAPLLRFDVQLAGSPTKAGYTALDQNTLYTEQLGYGFTSAAGPGGRDRGAGEEGLDDLQRDFLLPSAATPLRFDVPNGTYAVEVIWGDRTGTARLGVTVEGVNHGTANAPRGGTSSKVIQPVVVTDGHIDLVADGWLNGLQITSLLYAPTALVAGDVSIDGTAVAVPLSWEPARDVAGYRVYRHAEGAAEPTALADVTDASYVDTTADVGLRYTYTVVALDGGDNESVPSNEVELTTVDPDVPTAPTPSGLAVADVEKHAVSLAWEPVEGALFYHVYRTDRSGDQVLLARTARPEYVDTDVLTTVEYTYAVAAVNAGGVSELSDTVSSAAVTKLSRQAERIGRQPVAVAGTGTGTGSDADGVYVGWRMQGDDPQDVAFHVYRDGERITDRPLTGATNLLDADGTADATYRVATVADGIEHWATGEFTPWDGQTLDIPLDKPADGTTKDGQPYTYSANDASVADLDGDGEYEYVVKWYPSNAKDNSQGGYTGNTYLDAYELDGTRLWRIDLGRNIRSGAHYTQFQVYDYDGDGRAEVAMKTADGTADADGTVIGDARADFRTSAGYVLSGPEFLTVFDGATGVALDTIDYVPPRGDVGSWGDTYGNRVDRFLATTAYLDGEHPSMVFSRGYYTRAVIAAFDFDGEDLTQRWVFDTDVAGDAYRGQGNHDMQTADVDGDQKDEIVFGSMTIDDDGQVLLNTGLGHGDAMHVSDFDPSRPGLEQFAAHEDMGRSGKVGATFRDAATGKVIWSIPAERDTGRAAMGDIDPRHDGAEGWAVGGDAAWNSPVGKVVSSSTGEVLSESIPAANFLTFWDGDLLAEIGNHDWDVATSTGVPTIAKWDYENGREVELYRAEGTLSNNSTKGTPSLQADLFGDWREELVTRTADSTALRIATTVVPTEHRLRTLMSDPQYRTAVTWQNTGYNQPPHTSYFIGEGMTTPAAPRLAYTSAAATAERVPGPARGVPGKVSVHVEDAEDGRIEVEAWIAYGANAQRMALLVDGEVVRTVELVDRTPRKQEATLEVTGVGRGTHRIAVVATNQHGETSSKEVRVRMR